MNGNAPNSPETGSQVERVQKAKPNLRMESADCHASTMPMPATSRSTTNAKGLVNLRKRPRLLVDHRLRQRRVSERAGELLSVRQRPFHEVGHQPRALVVVVLFVQKNPGERGDRIRSVAGRVRDRDAEVVG